MSKTTGRVEGGSGSKVAEFATLKERLDAAAKEQFTGGELADEIEDIDIRVIPAVGAHKHSREELGIILVEKHKKYTKARIWLQVERAIAKELKCCRRKVFDIRTDAELALKAGENRLAALKGLGIEPFQAKFRPVMVNLQNPPEDETQEEAAHVAAKVLSHYRETKKAPKKTDRSQLITDDERFNEAVNHLAEVLIQIEPDKRKEMAEKIAAASLRKVEENTNPANHGETLAKACSNPYKQSNSGLSAVRSAASVPECQQEQAPQQQRHSEYVGCDHVLVLDEETFAPGALGRILRETGATRTYIPDGFELFSPNVMAKFIDRQIAKYPAHTFLVLTSDPEYFLNVQKFLGALPDNIRPGLLVETIDQLDGIKTFAEVGAKHKWLSLLLAKSDSVRSLANVWPKREFEFAGFDLVVAGSISPSEWGLSAEDEIFIKNAAIQAGCCFYSSSRVIRNAFLDGDPEAFDRVVREHSDVDLDGMLKEIRTRQQLPPELGGPPEDPYSASDRMIRYGYQF
jgi:hypothetical protein